MKTQLVYPAWPRSQRLQLLFQLWLSGLVLLGTGIYLWFPVSLTTRIGTALLLILSWQKLLQSLGDYTEALAEHCQLEPAQKYLQLALKLSPRRADLWLLLGNIQADLENWPIAQAAYQKALHLRPDLIEALNGLGFARLILGETAPPSTMTAQAYFKRAYELRRGISGQIFTHSDSPLQREYSPFSPFKLKHDLEQWQWLCEKGLLPVSFQGPIETLTNRYQASLGPDCPHDLIPLPANAELQSLWGKNLYFCAPPESPKPALQELSPTLKASISAQTNEGAPVYWDHFLSPAALNSLQDFCLDATIWHDGSRRAGYLASTLDDGFNCPLLYQIAEELRQALPEIFAEQRLVYMWAFKCDSEGQGIALHNDSAYLNLNFWITPDHANLDPETGGLLIYPQDPPREWNFEDLRMDQAGIENWLQAHPQTPLKIPYRCNRAVLFHSRLFHASDVYKFQPGYANRRINITLLFGKKILKYYPRPTLVPLLEG
ncbi:MAG: hypothetical protein IV090_09060 [Candidatus Sericytochromatia bacterium]|nr:hypothetical protein [Candidatus Sericytochromatia bacterium]